AGVRTQDSPYTFGTELEQDVTPNGPVALDVAPNGDLVIVFEASGDAGLYSRLYSSSLTAGLLQQLKDLGTWDAGVTVKFRALSRSIGTENKVYIYDVFASRNGSIGNPA